MPTQSNEIRDILSDHPASRRLVQVLARTVAAKPHLATVLHAELADAAKTAADNIATELESAKS